MTLLTTEGFETQAVKDGWSFTSPQFVAGRFGGFALSTGTASYSPPAATDVIVVGWARRINTSGNAQVLIDLFDAASANLQARVNMRADRVIDIARGSSVVVASSAGPVGAGGDWLWVEVKARLNDVTGFIEVKVNGTVVASYVGDTVNTTSAGLNNGVTRIDFPGASGNGNTDDVIVLDTAGAAPFNNYLGECGVETLVPNGNGVASQLVGSDGNSVDNYLLVDELPAVDTDRVESSTTGNRDLYTFTDPAAGIGEVLAVTPCVAVSKVLPGPATIKLVERLGGTERISAAKAVTNLGWRTTAPAITDPNGAAWTPANVTAAQFGVEVG